MLKLTTDKHEASRGLSATAELLVFLLSSPKMFFFRPIGATRCPDKREIWHGEQTSDPLLHATFHV